MHFGHRVSRWNPKMGPYIHSRRNLIHIIDLQETVRGLIRSYRFVAHVVGRGRDVVFVGTKRQAKNTVTEQAQRCGMHFVTERWLGGTLTNFQTIRSRLKRLEYLEGLEESGAIQRFSKKMISSLNRERRKINRNLSGIRRMSRLPAAMLVVDPRREHIAVREANKLHIPVVSLMDTDSDPDLVDIPIPGNDDAMRAIEIVVHKWADAVLEGMAAREVPADLPAPVKSTPAPVKSTPAPVKSTPERATAPTEPPVPDTSTPEEAKAPTEVEAPEESAPAPAEGADAAEPPAGAE